MICHRCGNIFPEDLLSCPGCGLECPGRAGSGHAADAAPAGLTTETPGFRMMPYAGFWRRAAALVLDRMLICCVNLVLTLCYALVTGEGRGPDGFSMLFTASFIFGVLLGWLYFTLLESSVLQATVGKAALGIIVTGSDGGRISLARANGRYWAKIISAIPLGFGYVMAGFTAGNRALHDMIAGTYVVRK